MNNTHPFIVENGGAIFIPRNYFAFPVPGALCDGYTVVKFGDSYPELVAALRAASAESGCRLEGFSDWSVEQISRICDLSPEDARRAKLREYDEPFRILDDRPASTTRLLAAIETRGKRWTRGGRFHHITGAQGKEEAVRVLIGFFRQAHRSLRTIGLGDGLNDAGLLQAVDVPFIIRSAHTSELAARVPAARVTRACGAEGWNEAVLAILNEPRQR
jgi:mannosyl-3-phosphoglycerate phosphatase